MLVIPAVRAENESTDDTKSEIMGSWKITACTFSGGADQPVVGDVHTILKDRMIRPNRRTQYGYTVDRKGEINLTAPRLGNEHLRGIYSLEGDTLKICYAYEPELTRPSEFVSPVGQRVYLYEFAKIKVSRTVTRLRILCEAPEKHGSSPESVGQNDLLCW